MALFARATQEKEQEKYIITHCYIIIIINIFMIILIYD